MRKIIIITLIATIAPAIVFILVGCMKAPPVNKDFGPEVNANDVNMAKASSLSESIYSLKLGEYVSYDISVKYESMAPIITNQIAEKVTGTLATNATYKYTITRTNRKWEGGQNWKVWDDQYTVEVDKPSPQPATEVGALLILSTRAVYPKNTIYPEGLSQDLIPQQIKAMEEAPPYRITYHNLKKQAVTIPFPVEPMKRSDCGGVEAAKCGLPLRAWAVSYDKVLHYDNTWDKQSWVYYISGDVPYLAGIISACVSGSFTFSDQLVGALQCQTLTDFQYGK